MVDELRPQDIEDLLHDLFTGKNAAYGGYRQVGPYEEIVKGWMVRATLQREDRKTDVREVSLFLKVEGVGGELWEHEVRSLLRLKALGHPALPNIVDGRFDLRRQVAFIMTKKEGIPLCQDWDSVVNEWATTHRVAALEQFSLLVDALSQLHGTRIMHRNVTLGAVRINPRPRNPARTTLSLGRFEVSALLNNLLYSVIGPTDRDMYDQVVRALFLTPPSGIGMGNHLAYLAPETYPSLFGEMPLRRPDHGSTDVFGLGVLGWELFHGPMTKVLPEELAAVERATRAELPSALADLHAAIRRALNTSPFVPQALRLILADMLDPSPGGRSSSFEVSGALERNLAAICAVLESDPDETRPRLLAFMPEESQTTIYENRGWIDHSPRTPQGCQELQVFLEDELRQAELVHSPTGAAGFVKGDAQSLDEAQWVLIGAQAVWFCAYLFDETVMGRRTATHTDTLVIKYLVDKRFAAEILSIRPKRRIGKVDLVPFRLKESLADERKDRPSWEKLSAAVASEKEPGSAKAEEMLRAMGFMLEYQWAALRARQYPYVLTERDDGSLVLTHDRARDRNWLHSSPLLTAYAADTRRRPALGDFGEALLSESGKANISIVGDRATPYFGTDATTVELKYRADQESVVIAAPPGRRHIPTLGWLRPLGDRGTEVQLGRETRGLGSLRQKPGLAEILQSPHSIELRSRREVDLDQRWQDSAPRLRGRAPDVIADMLSLYPFYALQGPPGTGKTTVVTHAVERFLKTERGARVLVSAQSNDALNHLAGKLTGHLKAEIDDQSVLILRELSRSKERTDLPKELQRFTVDPLAENLVKRINDRVAQDYQGALNDTERKLMKRWADTAQSDLVELTERIRAGADIVLATCSIAGGFTDEVRDPTDVFDWVIIEEAAKAWPTEIIMPLVLGVRWTLVGDHHQLGPHRAGD